MVQAVVQIVISTEAKAVRVSAIAQISLQNLFGRLLSSSKRSSKRNRVALAASITINQTITSDFLRGDFLVITVIYMS